MRSLIKKALDRVMEAEEQGPITEPVEQGTWTVAVPAFGPGPAGVVNRRVVSAGTPEEALQAADPEFREADPENLVFDRLEGSDVWWVSSREVADFMVVIASGDVPEEEMVKRSAMARAEREAGPEEDSELQIYGQEPSGAMGEQDGEGEVRAKTVNVIMSALKAAGDVKQGEDDRLDALMEALGFAEFNWELSREQGLLYDHEEMRDSYSWGSLPGMLRQDTPLEGLFDAYEIVRGGDGRTESTKWRRRVKEQDDERSPTSQKRSPFSSSMDARIDQVVKLLSDFGTSELLAVINRSSSSTKLDIQRLVRQGKGRLMREAEPEIDDIEMIDDIEGGIRELGVLLRAVRRDTGKFQAVTDKLEELSNTFSYAARHLGPAEMSGGPGEGMGEQEGSSSVTRSRDLENELGAIMRSRVFQMIEDRVGRGKIKDLSLLDPVTDAISDAVRDISSKVAEVLSSFPSQGAGGSAPEVKPSRLKPSAMSPIGRREEPNPPDVA